MGAGGGAGDEQLVSQPLMLALTQGRPAQKLKDCAERHIFLALHQLQLADRHDPQSVLTEQSASPLAARPRRAMHAAANFIG